MTDVVLAKYKIIENKHHIWLDWCEELKRRKIEVIETLQAEKVFSEACFISDDGKYVYIFMEASDMNYAQEMGKTSKFPIDASHKQNRSLSLEYVGILKELFHFERISTDS